MTKARTLPFADVPDVDTGYHQLSTDRYHRQSVDRLHDDGLIDMVAVERLLRGFPVAATPRERAAAIIVGVGKYRMSDVMLADMLGYKHNVSVKKVRERLGVPAPVRTTDELSARAMGEVFSYDV